MQRRIFGIETEFGIRYSMSSLGHLGPEEAARKLFRPVVEWGRSSNVFLENGSRLYLDVGSHPEYATAECSDLTDLVRQDKAGERLFEKLAVQAEDALNQQGMKGKLHLFKNNADSAGNSFGSHENYLLSRKAEFSRLVRFLVPFLVSRQLVVGAGRVHPTGPPQTNGAPGDGEATYSFSQRADYVWEAASSATTRSRPLINTRDEPHADASLYRRLHVIVGDSNMSETTTLARAGMTDIILRMIEDHQGLEDLELANTGQALRTLSHDMTGRTPVDLKDGRHMSGLELQWHYLDAASKYIDDAGSSRPETEYILDLWERTLDAIEIQDTSSIDTEIDWAIKKKLLDRTADKLGTDYAHARIAQLDLAYHDIKRDRGVYYLLERKGLARRWVDEESVTQAQSEPPRTRAALRGRFIEAARGAGLDYTVDWVHYKINQQLALSHVCQDPFATTDEDIEESIRVMRGATRRAQPAMPPLI
ncbi:Pup--protein ligase [Rothia uropygioeca]|uniref:Pup--protein ligase n=1 Tax=Kocuria sp. 257 TaxID=2021970 RepID=UPI001012AECA|nr:Pup--protein ligase [Kocuria sp. 257]